MQLESARAHRDAAVGRQSEVGVAAADHAVVHIEIVRVGRGRHGTQSVLFDEEHPAVRHHRAAGVGVAALQLHDAGRADDHAGRFGAVGQIAHGEPAVGRTDVNLIAAAEQIGVGRGRRRQRASIVEAQLGRAHREAGMVAEVDVLRRVGAAQQQHAGGARRDASGDQRVHVHRRGQAQDRAVAQVNVRHTGCPLHAERVSVSQRHRRAIDLCAAGEGVVARERHAAAVRADDGQMAGRGAGVGDHRVVDDCAALGFKGVIALIRGEGAGVRQRPHKGQPQIREGRKIDGIRGIGREEGERALGCGIHARQQQGRTARSGIADRGIRRVGQRDRARVAGRQPVGVAEEEVAGQDIDIAGEGVGAGEGDPSRAALGQAAADAGRVFGQGLRRRNRDTGGHAEGRTAGLHAGRRQVVHEIGARIHGLDRAAVQEQQIGAGRGRRIKPLRAEDAAVQGDCSVRSVGGCAGAPHEAVGRVNQTAVDRDLTARAVGVDDNILAGQAAAELAAVDRHSRLRAEAARRIEPAVGHKGAAAVTHRQTADTAGAGGHDQVAVHIDHRRIAAAADRRRGIAAAHAHVEVDRAAAGHPKMAVGDRQGKRRIVRQLDRGQRTQRQLRAAADRQAAGGRKQVIEHQVAGEHRDAAVVDPDRFAVLADIAALPVCRIGPRQRCARRAGPDRLILAVLKLIVGDDLRLAERAAVHAHFGDRSAEEHLPVLGPAVPDPAQGKGCPAAQIADRRGLGNAQRTVGIEPLDAGGVARDHDVVPQPGHRRRAVPRNVATPVVVLHGVPGIRAVTDLHAGAVCRACPQPAVGPRQQVLGPLLKHRVQHPDLGAPHRILTQQRGRRRDGVGHD